MSEGTAVVVSLQKNLASLRERVEALQVVTPEDYVNICNLIVEGRAFIKRWEEVDGPGIRSAKDHLDLLRNEHKSRVVAVEQIVSAATQKKEIYAQEERKKAQAEQDRINRENADRAKIEADKQKSDSEEIARKRKLGRIALIRQDLKHGKITKRQAEKLLREAGATEEAELAKAAADAEDFVREPAQVEVKPLIPSVAGVKNQVYYFAECTDEDALIRAWIMGDSERRAFLRQFLQVNVQAIGKYARDTKDNKEVEKALPGVRAWSKG